MNINERIESNGGYSRENICAFGVRFTDHTDIGTAEIFSALIRETGRICENYASDILYFADDMKRSVDGAIRDWDGKEDTHPASFTSWLGLRKNGVNWFTIDNDAETGGRVLEWKEDGDFIVRMIFQVCFDKCGKVTFILTRHD